MLRVSKCGLGFIASTKLSSLALIAGLAGPAAAQGPIAFRDISPDRSDLDQVDPDGATGGRVNGLARVAGSTQTFFAASEWGGIYRTDDGGLTWRHLPGHRSMATWDVEVDPSNARRVYATSFYDGRVTSIAGINVSTDGGNSWTHPATGVPPVNFCLTANRRTELSAFGIAIDPANNRNVYVGTSCGLAISNDSGVNWRFVDASPGDPADDVWDVLVHHGGIIDLCGDDGHMRSTDGGASWTTVTAGGTPLPAGRCSIAASPDEAYVLFAVTGTTLRETDNAGGSWNTTFVNPAAQGRVPFVETNDRSGTAFDLWFGDVGLWRAGCTTPTPPASGGIARCPTNTWSVSFTRSAGGHDDTAAIVFNPTAQVDSCPLLFASDGGVYRNTSTATPGCHSPAWEQPEVTPHGLWLFGMGGAKISGLVGEDLYFGNQDNGSFATRLAGAPRPPWNNRDCCDGFDDAADAVRIVYTICCFRGVGTILFQRNPGMTGGGAVTLPAGTSLPGFRAPDIVARYATGSYALVTTGGMFVTTNIAASPVVWTRLGTAASTPAGACGIVSSTDANGPVFYVQAGACNERAADTLWRYNGTTATGAWQQIDPPGGTGGFGVHAAAANNADLLMASHIQAAVIHMVVSNDGGASWTVDAALDNLMTGGGVFQYRNTRGPTDFTGFGGYPQPTLVAIDPANNNLRVAGGADSGVFLTRDGGARWQLITDPINGRPHLPRPRFAHFDHAAGKVNLYIGTQGRGVSRFQFADPALPPPIGDGLFLFRPGLGAAWIAHSAGNGTFSASYAVGDNGSAPPNGIAGYDLLSSRDQALVFDHNGDGRDDLFLYRPGTGAAWVARSNGGGSFTGVYAVGDNGSAPPNGIAGYDLLSPADRVLAFDYDGDGNQDLFLQRPGRGAAWVARSNGDGTFTGVYTVGDNGAAPPNGIAGYDLLSPRDQVLPFDHDGDGRQDLFLYRPGQGAAWVARSNGDGTFTGVYTVGDNGAAPPNGIAGYDLLSPRDQVLPFDHDGDGRQDLFLYRPGQGAAWVARSNGNGTFTAVYAVGDNGAALPNGIAGYDLLSPADRVLAFDYNGDGKQDLFLHRPGQGAAWVARSNGDGTFTAVYAVGDNGAAPPNGIAGYDLLSPRDQVLAFDYNLDGCDDLFLYRPGQGAAWVARSNCNGTFTAVYAVGDNGGAPPNGIAGYDLLSPADRVLRFKDDR